MALARKDIAWREMTSLSDHPSGGKQSGGSARSYIQAIFRYSHDGNKETHGKHVRMADLSEI